MYQRELNYGLDNETPLIINVELAVAIGLNEAIILRQIHYWIILNKKTNQNYHEYKYWTYNSIEKWNEQFPFWSKNTVKRTFTKLEETGFLLVGNYNKASFDRTKWYTINYCLLYETLNDYRRKVQIDDQKNKNALTQNGSITLAQNEPMQDPKLGLTIPETNTENTQRILNNNKEKKKKQTYFDVINNFTDNKLLQQAINDWIEMRTLKKAKLTNTALRKTLDKIKTMVREDDINQEQTMIAIFDQSTINSWTGIFPLKTNTFNQNNFDSNTKEWSFSDFLEEEKTNEQNRNDIRVKSIADCIPQVL